MTKRKPMKLEWSDEPSPPGAVEFETVSKNLRPSRPDPAEVIREALNDGGYDKLHTDLHLAALAALDTLVAERERLREDLNEAISTMLETAAERDTLRQQVAALEGERDEANNNCWDALQTLLEYQGDIQALTAERDRYKAALERFTHTSARYQGSEELARHVRELAAAALQEDEA